MPVERLRIGLLAYNLAISGPMSKARADTGRVILVLEDDLMLGELVSECLTQDGHAVTWATSAEEALRIAATLQTIDLLLSDLMMPGLDPREGAARLRQARPDLKVVFMSGHLEGPSPAEGDGFLSKPFTPADVRQAVAQVLGSVTEGGPGKEASVKPKRSRRPRP